MFFIRLRFVCSCFSLDTISDESNCEWRFLWCTVLYMLFAVSDKCDDICNLRICEFCSCVRGLVVEFDYLFEWYYMQIRTCVLSNYDLQIFEFCYVLGICYSSFCYNFLVNEFSDGSSHHP